jgi:hypothetical protein
MAIEKVIEIKVDAKDAVKQLDNINNELLEQKKITIELEREQLRLEKALTDTPKNALSAQAELTKQLKHVKDALKDQRISTKELTVAKTELTKQVKDQATEEKELGATLTKNSSLMEALDSVTGGAASGFLGLKDSIIAGTKASIAFITTPLGIVLGAIVAVALLVKNAFDRNEESATKLKGVFNVLSVFANKVLDALVPLGKFIIDNLVKGFEILGKSVTGTMNLIADGLELIGFDEEAKAINDFSDGLEKSAKSAMELAKMEKLLEKNMRELAIIQLKYQRDAEKLRQIRDDESKSIADRIKANDDLGKLLKKQANDELAIANQALQVAQAKLANDKKNKELLDAEAEARLKIEEINERITSQESEQKTNLNSLKKERLQAQEEITKKYKEEADKRAEIARGEVEKLRNIYQEYEKKIQDINAKSEEEKTALERKRAEVAIDQVETDETKKEIARKKVKEYYDIIEAERQTKLVEAERVKQEQIKSIEDEFSMRKAEQANLTEEERLAFELQKIEIEKQKKILELDNLKATEEQKLEVLSYYKQREDKLNDDFTKAEMARQKLVNKQKLDLTKSTFGALATILGENSKAGKLFASGQALINTWQGVTEVLSNKTTLPEPFGTINKVASTGAVIASGLKAVQQINSVKTLGGGGGGQSGGGASPQITPPSFNIVQGTGTNQIAESIANANQKPVKAYVVSSDVRTNDSLERNIQKSSEF